VELLLKENSKAFSKISQTHINVHLIMMMSTSKILWRVTKEMK